MSATPTPYQVVYNAESGQIEYVFETGQIAVPIDGSVGADTKLFIGAVSLENVTAQGGGDLTIADDATNNATGSINTNGSMLLTANCLADGTGTFFPRIKLAGEGSQPGISIDLGLLPDNNTSLVISDDDNTPSNDPSVIVNIASTTQGFLPPCMTTTQKNAITAPATGLVVFDTSLGKLCVFSTTWQTVTSS